MRRREFITLIGGVALPKLMRGPALKQRRSLRVSTNIDVVQEHDDIMYPDLVLFVVGRNCPTAEGVVYLTTAANVESGCGAYQLAARGPATTG